MQTVTSGVSVGKHEGLVSLTGRPLIGEQRGVPVDLIEEMGLVFPSLWAVTMCRELHVGLVVVQALRRIVAGWEVDISTERRGISIAVLIGEADTSASISWILDSYSMETIRVRGVQWLRSA